ncbi:MAG: DUF3343 domain-containing protein [Lachnospiraceae bacterium]|nr:DUF3343 domain-containing protein [Lachnospiraceae bacterium]
MREKKLQLVISFESTANAMAVERFCLENDLPGRLIPVPKEITAGCGLAWKADVSKKDELVKAFEENDIIYDGMYEITI